MLWQAWVARLTEQAEAMIERRFVPSLRRSGMRYQVSCPPQLARHLSMAGT